MDCQVPSLMQWSNCIKNSLNFSSVLVLIISEIKDTRNEYTSPHLVVKRLFCLTWICKIFRHDIVCQCFWLYNGHRTGRERYDLIMKKFDQNKIGQSSHILTLCIDAIGVELWPLAVEDEPPCGIYTSNRF